MKNSLIFFFSLQFQISHQLFELGIIIFPLWVRTLKLKEEKKLSCCHVATQWQSQGLIQFSVNQKPAAALPPFLGGPVLLSIQCVKGSGDSPSSLLVFLSPRESLLGWRGDFLSCPCQYMSEHPVHSDNSMGSSQLHWELLPATWTGPATY